MIRTGNQWRAREAHTGSQVRGAPHDKQRQLEELAMPKEEPKNPNPGLFTTFERLDITHRVEVREDNIHLIAKQFGWRVAYDYEEPRLIKPSGDQHQLEVGSWVDHRGLRWNPEPMSQGWSPAGTYHANGRADA